MEVSDVPTAAQELYSHADLAPLSGRAYMIESE